VFPLSETAKQNRSAKPLSES